MIEQQSHDDSAVTGRAPSEPAAQEGSTIAAPLSTTTPAGIETASPIRSESSAIRAESPGSAGPLAIRITDPPAAPMAPADDKTVISKRAPLEAPLPVLPTPQSLGQALAGKTLDHYELAEFVGGGGMGAVFRSLDTRLGRTVAVKVLSRDHTDEETIRRFRNEAQSAARLDHPNIARVYFVGEDQGWNYIVFEYIDGTNLRDIVEKQGPLPIEDALNYTLQVAEALEHASQRDVVHRDIKPSNVLVTPSGQIKLVDMGLARLHQVESSSEDLTASGVMLGTFDYISPEQARDPRSADVRSDIYSLGCTLYFMLAGRPPFPEGTAVQKLLKHNSEEPPDLRLFRPELPPPVLSLIGRMLAKRPSQRHQSPRELTQEILGLAQQLGLSGVSDRASSLVSLPQPQSSVWSRIMPILAPAAALILVLWVLDNLSRDGGKLPTIAQRPKLEESTQASITSKAAADSGDAESSANDTTENSVEEPASPSKAANRRAVPGSIVTDAKGSEQTGSQDTDVAAGNGATNNSVDSANATAAAGHLAPPAAIGQLRAAPMIDETLSGGILPTAGIASPSASPKITRIVVRPQGVPAIETSADSAVVESLIEALEKAQEHGVGDIELAFNGPLTTPPVDLVMPKGLRIVAAAGHAPVLVFQPEQFATERDKQMIRLIGGRDSVVEFRGIELRLELPSTPSSGLSGWSLLAIHRMQRLSLANCVLTVVDAAGTAGTPVHQNVAMLAFQPRPVAEMMKMMEDMNAMVKATEVSLTNCVARGEATVLAIPDESPLRMTWTNGLLVTPFRLIETGGTSMPKPGFQDKLDIELTGVTAIIPQGLILQDRQTSHASQLKLEVSCTRCLLVTDPQAPLFEFGRMSSEEEVRLDYTGQWNLYPPRREGFFISVTSPAGQLVTKRGLDNLGSFGDDDDIGVITWEQPPPELADVPAHLHVPSDYLLDADSSAAGDPRGFTLTDLPPLE